MNHAVLPVQINDRWIALDAGPIQEVLGQRPWVRIPGAPANLPGVLAWRGRAIAVLDLGAVLGVADPAVPGTAKPRAVVIQVGGSTFAILVDAAREVYEIARELVRSPHATTHRFARGEIEVLGTPMPIVDLPALLASVGATAPEAG